MSINFTNHKKIIPENLQLLSRGEKLKLSPESIGNIIEESFNKISNNERLDFSQLNTIISFFDKIDEKSKIVFLKYLSKHLGKSEIEDEVTIFAYNELFPFEFIKNLSFSEFIQSSLTASQKNSFNDLFIGNLPTVNSNPETIISFISDLKINRNNYFTNGQLKIAEPYIRATNFGILFENKFERLLEFATNAKIDFPSGVARFLDEQLGKRIVEDIDGVRAKVINESLGYYKYQRFINANNLSETSLPNFLKLKNIIVSLNNAIKILTEQEPRRGMFWKGMLEIIDGLEIQKQYSTTTYNVAVAFFVGNYVFCDFGPTNNAIYIYKRNIFEANVKNRKDWKQVDSLGLPKISHTGAWEVEVKRIILNARSGS
jgi:hypothetical protein